MVEQAKIDEATIDRCTVELLQDRITDLYNGVCDKTDEDNLWRVAAIGNLSGILDMAQKIKEALKGEERNDDE